MTSTHRVWLTVKSTRVLRLAGNIKTDLSETELRKELGTSEPAQVLARLSTIVVYSSLLSSETTVDITIKKE